MAWLYLDYDQGKIDAATVAGRAQGVTVEGIYREDQLATVAWERVELVLVGDGWKVETIWRMRDMGLTASVVRMVDALTSEAEEWARDAQCVDVATQPPSIPYLRAWAKPIAATAANEEAAKPAARTVIEEILAEAGRGQGKRTYTQGLRVGMAAIDALAGRAKAKTILIHGVKGRVGKTTLVCLLARHFALQGANVAAVDLDSKGTLIEMMGGGRNVTMAEWLKLPVQMDERMVRQSLIHTRGTAGVWVLPSGGSETADADAALVKKVVYNIAAHMDVLLIDTGPELNPTVRTALSLAHSVVYAFTPDTVSLPQSVEGYETAVALKGDGRRVVPVCNLVEGTREHKKVLGILTEAPFAQRMHILYRDRALEREAVRQQMLIGSRRVRKVVGEVAQDLGDVAVQPLAAARARSQAKKAKPEKAPKAPKVRRKERRATAAPAIPVNEEGNA